MASDPFFVFTSLRSEKYARSLSSPSTNFPAKTPLRSPPIPTSPSNHQSTPPAQADPAARRVSDLNSSRRIPGPKPAARPPVDDQSPPATTAPPGFDPTGWH